MPAGKPMGPPRGARMKSSVKNPGKILRRLMKLIGKHYTPHLIVVVICIFISVLANVQGTLFTKTLVDDYITPMIGSADPDFGPLLSAILRVACFYAIGIAASFAYNRAHCVMCETRCLSTWKSCRSAILIPMRMAISCRSTQTISIRCVR